MGKWDRYTGYCFYIAAFITLIDFIIGIILFSSGFNHPPPWLFWPLALVIIMIFLGLLFMLIDEIKRRRDI